MRELASHELPLVSGAGGGAPVCTPDNTYGGVSNTQSFGQDLINLYEGLVRATSHVIERVANAL
ncbi:MAG TPA: hypothetical protein VKZ85_13440 [Woeseiaceae bacterium]|nr:hypothetical protein [Woeseiaceae bacterium]